MSVIWESILMAEKQLAAEKKLYILRFFVIFFFQSLNDYRKKNKPILFVYKFKYSKIIFKCNNLNVYVKKHLFNVHNNYYT